MRLWQTRFQVVKALESLPIPLEIVLESQSSPVYHVEERLRESGRWAQVVCTLQGEGVFRYGNSIYRMTPGKAFLECLGDPDASYYYPGYADKPWVFLWFSFCGPQSVHIVEELNARYGHVFNLPLDSGLVKHLESYHTQRDFLQMVSPTAGAKIVHDALAILGETMEGNLSTSLQAQLTHAAQELITSNLNRSLDLSLIADKLNVTREHLSRVFHSQTGISPGVFAANERMRAAGRMLMDNRMTCKEIGIRLGYDSASSFSRVFKAHFGMSPAAYKARTPENEFNPSDGETSVQTRYHAGDATPGHLIGETHHYPVHENQDPPRSFNPCDGSSYE